MSSYRVVRVSKRATHAQWATQSPPLAGEIVASTDAPLQLKVGDGATPFAGLAAYGGGSGAAASGPGGAVQLANGAGGLTNAAEVSWDGASKTLSTGNIGILKAATVAGPASPWSPNVGVAGVIPVTTAASLTIGVPTAAPPAGIKTYYALEVTNTHATDAVLVTFDTGTGQYKLRGRHPVKEVLAGDTVVFYIFTADGGANWYVEGRPYAPFDIKFFVGDTIAAGTILYQEWVHTGLRVPFNLADVGNSECLTPPTAATAFSVQRRIAGQSAYTEIGTCTFGASSTWSTWVFAGGAVEFAHGDRLRIVAPSNLNGLASLAFTLRVLPL